MSWPTTSRQSRGYGRSWEKLRELVLRRDNGLCQCIECQGGKLRVTRATQVDHRIPKADGGTDALDNLQAIAPECHARKTAAEQGHKLIERHAVALDGSPVGVKW